MRKGEAASAEFKAAAVAAVDDLLDQLTRHQAFEVVATNIGVHSHTVRNWWRTAHPELTLTADDRARLTELETQLTALTRLNQTLAARLRHQQPSGG